MNSEIPTKWEYLEQRFKDELNHECAKIAKMIDNLLQELNYPPTTPIWDDHYINGVIDKLDTYSIMQSVKYCSPCYYTKKMIQMDHSQQLHEDDCFYCQFNKHGGNILYYAIHIILNNRATTVDKAIQMATDSHLIDCG